MFTSCGTLFALVVLAASTAVSQPGEARREIRREIVMGKGMHESFFERLNLSDQQETQLRKLRIQTQKNRVQIHSKIHVARLDMKELFLAETPDRAAIEKIVKTISDLQHQAKVNHIDHLFDVYEILTPEQRKVWKKHMGEGGADGIRHMRRRMEMPGMSHDDDDNE